MDIYKDLMPVLLAALIMALPGAILYVRSWVKNGEQDSDLSWKHWSFGIWQVSLFAGALFGLGCLIRNMFF